MNSYQAKIYCNSSQKVGQTSLIQSFQDQDLIINSLQYQIQIQFLEEEPNFTSLATLSVYDITNQQSFQESQKILLSSTTPIKILVGTHRDQIVKRQITYDQVASIKGKIPNLIWFEVNLISSDENIDILIEQIKIAAEFNIVEIISQGSQNIQVQEKQSFTNDQYDFFFEEIFQETITEPFNGGSSISQYQNQILQVEDYEELQLQFQLFLKNLSPNLQQEQISQFVQQIQSNQEQQLKIKNIEQNLLIQQSKLEKQQDITKEKELELEKYYEEALDVIQSKSSQLIKKDQEIAQLKLINKTQKSDPIESKTYCQKTIQQSQGKDDFNFSGISDITDQKNKIINSSHINEKQSIQLLSEQTLEIIKPQNQIISPAISKEFVPSKQTLISPSKYQVKMFQQFKKQEVVKIIKLENPRLIKDSASVKARPLVVKQNVNIVNNTVQIIKTQQLNLTQLSQHHNDVKTLNLIDQPIYYKQSKEQLAESTSSANSVSFILSQKQRKNKKIQ
ncbi:hypothetical protein SS50377_21158 [Spironucleus salmonicida]|uniref:Uncharacterized protein n=1 Tax=Spironucleus salmonicida TaxID=348837 RepID=V6LT19_9EUKA|nr:hypothetical protein SS50377_21158 [Spironucleus salmonicida]|eukprot:EST43939.1 Hypothetical protein SS50377_16241 [Spironucleus salmonicida]